MLELNGWFFVLLVNFLILAFILNKILFQPMLKLFTERQEAIEGSLEKARETEARSEERMKALKSEISNASAEAKKRFDAIRAEGVERQRQIVDSATKEAMSMIEKARAELRTESEKARASLKSDIERFSDEIVGKLLKA